VVAIHPGAPPSPLSTKTVYEGRSVSDPFQEVGNAVSEIKGPLKDAVVEAKRVFSELGKRSEKTAENLDKTLENARTVSDDLRSGKGSIGRLLTDDSIYNDLKDAIAGIKRLTDDAMSGGGAVDMLLHDKNIAADLKRAGENLRAISDDVAAGRGTIGR